MKKENKFIIEVLIFAVIYTQFYFPIDAFAFTKIIDIVFDGKPVDPDKLDETLGIIQTNKLKNKKIKNPKKLKPDKVFVIEAMQADPQNIQLEIDTSEVIVKGDKDIQASISNKGFLDAVTEAVNLWDSVDTADITFAPLKFASGQANAEDGKNLITFRAVEAPENVPTGAPVFSIVTVAKTDIVSFMNELIMVKPGTILDADIIYDPTNNPCLALTTTVGTFKDGGVKRTGFSLFILVLSSLSLLSLSLFSL